MKCHFEWPIFKRYIYVWLITSDVFRQCWRKPLPIIQLHRLFVLLVQNSFKSILVKVHEWSEMYSAWLKAGFHTRFLKFYYETVIGVILCNRIFEDGCDTRSHTAIRLSLKTVLKKIPHQLFSLMKSMQLLRNDSTLRQVPIEKFNVFSSNFWIKWTVSTNLSTSKLSWLPIDKILWIQPFFDQVVSIEKLNFHSPIVVKR